MLRLLTPYAPKFAYRRAKIKNQVCLVESNARANTLK